MQKRYIASLLDQFPVFLNLHAPDGILVWCSRISYGLPDSIIGQPAEDRIHPCGRDRWSSMFSRVVYGMEKIPYSVRVIVPIKPGWITVHGCMGPIVSDGVLRYVAAVCYDATFAEPVNPCARFMLTATQRKIIAVLLSESRPIKTHAIAVRIGAKKSTSTLRTILASLADREILRNHDGGYEIHPDFRPLAVELLQ